jgi:acetylornithine deacetylase/succinyl-diaminopimelate desuccinylase-like protein
MLASVEIEVNRARSNLVAVDVTRLVESDVVVDLAQGICRIPSPLGGEKPLAIYVAGRLRDLGFEVELQDVVQDRPNVVAIRRGNPAYKSFMFNGHLDIPEPFGEWSHDPYDPWIADDLLFGGGLQDMKGGVASLIAGAAAAAQLEPATSGDVIVTAVMHHDTTGVGTKFFLEQNAWPIDAGVCGEPTDLKVQLFHGGAWAWEITTSGVPRHQSRLEEGVNAITGMMEIVRRLNPEALTYEPDARYPHLPRCVVGMIAGGAFTSMTAESCLARGDIRFLPSMSVDGMKADIRRIIGEVCAETPGLGGDVRTFAHQWPYEIAVSDPVVQSLIAAHAEVVGTPPEVTSGLPSGAFITDGADMVRHGIPTALYGPGDWNTNPDESIPISDLVTAARVYARLCADIISQNR